MENADKSLLKMRLFCQNKERNNYNRTGLQKKKKTEETGLGMIDNPP